MYSTYLSFYCVPTLLAKIHEVEDTALQVRKSGDTLHFDGVHILKRMVQDSRGIDHLPSHVPVVEMADEE